MKRAITSSPPQISIVLLVFSVVLSAAAQLLLRKTAGQGGDILTLFLRPGIAIGLVVYALGTALWIICLRRLDLALAYPASALQLLIIYAAAAMLLGESIPPLRLAGCAFIIIGLGMLFTESRRHA